MRVQEDVGEPVEGFKDSFAKPDVFDGMTLTVLGEDQLMSTEAFGTWMRKAIDGWLQNGRKGIWLRIPKEAAHLVPEAVDMGFAYHHASPEEGLVLTLWLPRDSPSKLPEYPHHQVGVAGMLLDGEDRVLVIQEKRGPAAGIGLWKLPGGLVDFGEDIEAAVTREVLEETGIHAKFEAIVAFRQTHFGPFKCTDLYLINAMRLDPDKYPVGDIPEPVPQQDEVEVAKWIPLHEFLGLPHYKKGLYGDMLRTAAGSCKQLQKDRETGNASGHIGLRSQKLKAFGRMESLFFAGSLVSNSKL